MLGLGLRQAKPKPVVRQKARGSGMVSDGPKESLTLFKVASGKIREEVVNRRDLFKQMLLVEAKSV